MPLEQWRRIRGEQEIIVRYEPERAIETLPKLVTDRADRERLLRLLQRLVNDPRVQQQAPTDEQVAMLARVQRVLGGPGAVPTQLATAG
jgi:hypothetical protein